MYYEVIISGHSDNSERRGIDHVDTLKQELLALPQVTQATLDLGNLSDDGTYPFTLVIAPFEKPVEDNKRSRRG